MKQWPWRTFEEFFRRHLIRKAIIEMTRTRDMQIAAIMSNSTWDDPKNQNAKNERIDGINDAWRTGVEIASSNASPEPEPDMFDDPLFRPLLAQGVGAQASRHPQLNQAGMGRKIIG